MSTRSDFTGTWRADLAASKLHGPMPDEITAVVDHGDDRLRVVMTIVAKGAPASSMAFEVGMDGDDTVNTVRGAEWISRSRWVGGELLIESDVTHGGRRMHFCDYWSLSEDGQRLTMEHRGDDLAGQITVLDRVDGGAPRTSER